MVGMLPTNNFRWGDAEKYTPAYISAMSDDADTGCFLEVDCEFPPETRDVLADFPPMPVSREVAREELSSYQNDLVEETMRGRYVPCRKLVPDLLPRQNYGVHYRVLASAMSLGIKHSKKPLRSRMGSSEYNLVSF
jgi:hypothetical protein